MRTCRERVIRTVLGIIALSTVISLLLIAIFVVNGGLAFILQVGVKDFIFSSEWSPTTGKFGIGIMILASLCVTIGALIIGAPFGVGAAIFLNEFAPPGWMKTLKPAIELLAAIPSVVYGFIGMVVLVPWIRTHLGGSGFSLLAACIILGVMILPTILSISCDAIASVPNTYREGALALGATRWQTVWRVVIKAASSGIVAGIILGMGRAIGETMAVMMVAGNSVKMFTSLLEPVRTLTANIAMEMSYATGMHQQALFATSIVLFIAIMVLNSIAIILTRRGIRRK
jgi:phosphate ABC transporter permease protein PstC